MVRTLAVTVVLTGLAGFALGWLAFSETRTKTKPSPPPSPSPPPTAAARSSVTAPAADAAGVATVIQRFTLRPGDVAADRETPAVAVGPDGTLMLAWASQEKASDNVRNLYLARSRDRGTTFDPPSAWRPVPIYRFTSDNPARGRSMAFSTHVLPRLAATGDSLVLGWVEAIDGGPAVKFLVARSVDGGRSFSDPIAVHGGDASRPGFTTLVAGPDGGLACGWIDGRGHVPQPYFSASPADSAGFAPERLVFEGPDGKGICPCCDVAVAVAGAGADRAAFVAFRNSDEGHRDIWLARADGNGEARFAPPVPVTREPWTFNGCPHDAPSLAVVGDRLHVAWMDGHTGTGRIYHAMTPLAEATFHPRPLGASPAGRTPASQAHPKLLADGKGRIHAVWDEGLAPDAPAEAAAAAPGKHQHAAPAAGGAGRAILYAVSRDGGASFTAPHAVVPSLGVYQSHPALTAAPDGTVFVAWNEIDQDGKHIVCARLASLDPEPRTP
jgi:hypothetical protein